MSGAEAACRDCGKALESGLFRKGETRVLGAAYCESCVRARTLYCHTCRASLRPEDFSEGKAVTLLGRRFCENCLETAVQKGRDKAAKDPSRPAGDSAIVRPAAAGASEESGADYDSIAIRRLYGRYVPPSEAVLTVKAGGLASLLGNRVRLWLDVSEGGFRAIIAGSYKTEALLSGTLSYPPSGQSFPFKASVKHVRASQRYPGCTLVGCRFEAPSRELQSFIMGKMSGRPVMIPAPSSPSPKPSRRPSSTSIPPASPARA